MKYAIFTQDYGGIPFSLSLKREGYDVVLGQIQDVSELKNDSPEECSEDKKERLTQYDGLVKKVPAKELMKSLIKVKNKDEWFIFFDHNSLWYYSEILLKAGFKNGLFPTKLDYEFEKNREEAMAFVEANYPDVKLIPFTEHGTVDEAIAYLNENPNVYVLQSKGDFVSTVVPSSDDAELATKQLINQLENKRSEYEEGGIILKTKLIKPVEITPQIVFYNGKPVFTDLDIETKNIGDGENNGNQVGCGSNLIIKTKLADKINQIAFPPKVYEMAKERTGMFVWDISLYIMGDGIYFGEFCSNRMGYDSSMTEMTMAGGTSKFFQSVVGGKDPLKKDFGVAVRLFNLKKQCDVEIITDGVEGKTWLFEAKMKDKKIVSTASCWDLGVVTEAGDTVEEAVDELYENVDKVVFKEKYYRSKADFLAKYPTSIIQRFEAINHKYIDTTGIKVYNSIRDELKEELSKEYEDRYETLKQDYDTKYSKVKTLIKDIIYGQEE